MKTTKSKQQFHDLTEIESLDVIVDWCNREIEKLTKTKLAIKVRRQKLIQRALEIVR